jgi:diguanylate cyclase
MSGDALTMHGLANDEHERTVAFAKVALGQIRALRQPATPRNYRVWYTYATSYHPALNAAINETLARNGTITESDLEIIYDEFLSSNRITDHIDSVGAKVAGQIDSVISMIDTAAGSAQTYHRDLTEVGQQLGIARSDEDLRAIVDGLVATAKAMEDTNRELEAKLNDSRTEIAELQENLAAVRQESLTDPLTTLSNRKFFDQSLVNAIHHSVVQREPLSLLMADIDHFKAFNDNYGHLTGDQVLRLVAMAIKSNVKGQDTAARYGGEEFAIILPNTTLRSAATVADHIRRAVMTKHLMKRSTRETLGRITISVGVAEMRADDTLQTLIGRADACLYAAKRDGRNCVMTDETRSTSFKVVA